MSKMKPHTSLNEHIAYLDVLRLVASVAVVALHICADMFFSVSVDSAAWQTMHVYDSLTRFSVPVFFMISGALFLNPQKEFSIKDLFKKNILRLVTAYVFWSLFYAALSPLSLTDYLARVLTGPYHFWFLRVLLPLYLMVPILRVVAAKPQALGYWVVLGVICFFCLSTMDIIPGVQVVSFWIKANWPLNLFIGYHVYFLLGYYLRVHSFRPTVIRLLYALGALGLLAMVLITSWWSIAEGRPMLALYEYHFLPVLAISCAVFLWFRYDSPFAEGKQKTSRIANKLAPYLLGIFLVHVFWLSVLERFGINALSFSPFLSVPLLTVLVFALSLSTTWIISKVPFINRYLI